MRTIVHEHWDLQQTKEEGLGLELAVLCGTLSMDICGNGLVSERGQPSLGEPHRLGSSWTCER